MASVWTNLSLWISFSDGIDFCHHALFELIVFSNWRYKNSFIPAFIIILKKQLTNAATCYEYTGACAGFKSLKYFLLNFSHSSHSNYCMKPLFLSLLTAVK